MSPDRAGLDRAREIVYTKVDRIDDREDCGELRFIGLGRVDIEIYRVVYTWRAENVVRIISAQKAGRHEREVYYRTTFP